MQEIITSITLGLLASASPCILPLYPGYLAYLSGMQEGAGMKARPFLGFLVLAGVLSMMILLGGLIAALALPLGRALALLIPLADALLIALGVLLLADKNPFKTLPQIQAPLLKNPYLNAYLYGLLYGPIALPCSGPLVVGAFAFSLSAAEAAGRLGVFLWFGLGFGLPLLGLSLLSAALQRSITRFLTRHTRAVNVIGGVLLISVGVIDFLQNREMIFLTLGL